MKVCMTFIVVLIVQKHLIAPSFSVQYNTSEVLPDLIKAPMIIEFLPVLYQSFTRNATMGHHHPERSLQYPGLQPVALICVPVICSRSS